MNLEAFIIQQVIHSHIRNPLFGLQKYYFFLNLQTETKYLFENNKK